ncbi:hypothetical protein KY284_008223 [Solanum tuberosum]|nr:hypothetical protein KY284_008223 [Solanum tuberosum]
MLFLVGVENVLNEHEEEIEEDRIERANNIKRKEVLTKEKNILDKRRKVKNVASSSNEFSIITGLNYFADEDDFLFDTSELNRIIEQYFEGKSTIKKAKLINKYKKKYVHLF